MSKPAQTSPVWRHSCHLDAIALSIERHEQSRAGLRIRDIADKLRAYYGYVPDEPQLPFKRKE